MTTIQEVAEKTKKASVMLSCASTGQKSEVLKSIHKELEDSKVAILEENQRDMKEAANAVQAGTMSKALLKRLDLSLPGKWDSMVQGVLDIDQLQDPVGKVDLARSLDNGLDLYRVSCPVGVLLIIFEARPEVVVQISCLSIKSGNAVLLKGGKEALKSNTALFAAIQRGILSSYGKSSISPDVVQLVETREDIKTLLGLDRFVDLVIPRGSNQLVRYVQENTRIPVLGHADGICSVYIDEASDLETAIRVVLDGKTNYPAACNATEKVLIHKSVVSSHLIPVIQTLLKNGVSARVDQLCLDVLTSAGADISKFIIQQTSGTDGPSITLATDEDFITEFLDLVIAVKVVNSLQDAISHINYYGSHHTDCIVTTNDEAGEVFMQQVDSAGVYKNASTRFADGFRYGFGAEIGVSTNKTHARGPVGLEGLLIYKYRVYGTGHIVAEYNDGTRKYNRRDLPFALPNQLE